MIRKIFFPGSFSPFHDGHYQLIKQFINIKDAEIIIIISSKNRENIETNKIYDFIKSIFKDYKNVSVVISENSPIQYVYEHTVEDKNVIYSLIRSNKNNDDIVMQQYYNCFYKGGAFYNKNITVEELTADYNPIKYNDSHNNDYISGTNIRKDLSDKNYKNFKCGYELMLNEHVTSEYLLKKFYDNLINE